MKRHSKWKILMLSLVLGLNIGTSTFTQNIYADTVEGQAPQETPQPAAELQIKDVKQSKNDLQIGEEFSITMKVTPLGDSEQWKNVVKGDGQLTSDQEKVLGYTIERPVVSGAGVDASKMSYGVSGGTEISGPGQVVDIEISGLIYTGQEDVSIDIILGNNLNENVIATQNISYKIKGKTVEDYTDSFKITSEENILVVPGATQKAYVKVTNVSKDEILATKAKLSLGKVVKGMEITQSEVSIPNIKSKETKTLAFTMQLESDVEGGLYDANLEIFGTNYPVKVQVDTSVAPSALEVGLKENSKFTPGVAKTATLVIKNVGDRDAKNVKVEIENSTSVAIYGGGNVKHIGNVLSKGSQEASFNFKLPANSLEEVPVKINLSYLSSTGEEVTESQYVYLNTTGSMGASEVVISNVISPTGTYGVDKNFTVKFNLSSKQGAENVKVSIKGDEGIIPKSQNLFLVDKLNAGETKQYSVTFAATAMATTGSHPVEVNVEYGTGDNKVTISQYGSVYIDNPKTEEEDEDDDDKIKGKPRVIIGEYVINPNIVKAGENFELELGFLNTSSLHTVSNLKANIKVVEQGENGAGNVFTPVDGSNTIYIANLAPGQVINKKVTMYTIPSASPKTYEIQLDMVYEDEDANEHTATENVGIPVQQVTRIEAGDIYAEYAQVGMETGLIATLYNRGRTDVTNMMVYVEGEGFTVIEGNQNFIGNFKQGETQSYEPLIIPDVAGLINGEIVIEYEDTAGITQVIREPFEFTAEEMMIEDPYIGGDMGEGFPGEDMGEGFPGEDMGEKNNTMIYVGIVGGVILAIIITLIVLKKRKAKKEEMMFDEE